MKKLLIRIVAPVAALMALGGCMATHELSYYPSARIDNGNFTIVRSVETMVSYKYILGFGGKDEPGVVDALKQRAELAENELLANVDIEQRRAIYLGVVVLIDYYATADVVVFGGQGSAAPAKPAPAPVAAARPAVAVVPAQPVVKQEPAVAVVPVQPVAKQEPAAAVEPAQPVAKQEPAAAVEPVQPVVKQEPVKAAEPVAAVPAESADEFPYKSAELMEKTAGVVINGRTYEYQLLGLRAGRYEFIFKDKSGKKIHIEPSKISSFVLADGTALESGLVHDILRYN